jgi:hypothetical protein
MALCTWGSSVCSFSSTLFTFGFGQYDFPEAAMQGLLS